MPGTLMRFEGQELDDLPVSKSVHLLGFSDLMGALRLMDAAPAEVVLLGVQPASTDWGTVLTPEVEPARHALQQAALEQLAQWTTELSEIAVGRPSASRHQQTQADSSNAILDTH